jgi:4-amino-4-deoxychorismate lyase
MLINGVSGDLISIRDRGLLYGDGVFRTLKACGGRALHWPLHYQKLQHDCAALGITCPDFDRLSDELASLLVDHPDAVIKIIVTRGPGLRGYAPSVQTVPTHLWDVSPLPDYPASYTTNGVMLGLCSLRLSHQPRLAGIKHLNRLENVLAAAECTDFNEGLLLDRDGLVIEGVRSNLFLISRGGLITPELSHCGVAGVERDRVINAARQSGMQVEVRSVRFDELLAADEVFLTNSVFGLWPVARFADQVWTNFAGSTSLRVALDNGDVDG